MTRSCARRSLAAETIFMALVICCVFLTERMRRRISIRLGMCGCRLLRLEARLELLDCGFQLSAQLVIQHFLGADLVPDAAMRVVHETVELFLEPAALLYREIVEVALGAGEDDHDLFFNRQRL